jgi:hypothetical protein
VTISIDYKAVSFFSSSQLDWCLLDLKSISDGKPVLFMLGIRTISFGWEIRTLYSSEFYETLRSLIVLFWGSHLITFDPYFKSNSIEKIAIFSLGICTIQIRTHLVKYYQYITRVTYSKFWRNVPLFWMFASDMVT